MLELAPRTFRELAEIIHHETGIVLGPDKSYLVKHRLEPLVGSEDLEGFESLVRRLRMRTGTRLRTAVIDAITVKETRFFRDLACFDRLLDQVLPALAQIIDRAGKGRQRLRIWSAACATGQEAYSLAMLVREFVEDHAGGSAIGQFSILASDISAQAIAVAEAGRYGRSDVHRGLSQERLHRHFHSHGEKWHICEPVRRLVQFRIVNLLHPPAGLGAFDLILCRNVLIYFDDATRRRVCQGLYALLQPGGWLALGSAESLYGMEERFETFVHGRTILYQKPLRG